MKTNTILVRYSLSIIVIGIIILETRLLLNTSPPEYIVPNKKENFRTNKKQTKSKIVAVYVVISIKAVVTHTQNQPS